MKPFFTAIANALGNFLKNIRKDGNIFAASIAFVLKVAAVLSFIFMPQYLYWSVAAFALGWVIFYVSIIRWGYIARSSAPKVQKTVQAAKSTARTTTRKAMKPLSKPAAKKPATNKKTKKPTSGRAQVK